MTPKSQKRNLTQSADDGSPASTPPVELTGAGDLIMQVRATFGPLAPRAEPLNGAQVARRLLESPAGSEAGAQRLAKLMLAQDDLASDGAASAALIYLAALSASLLAIQAGANPGRLAQALKAGQERVNAELNRLAGPVESAGDLELVLRSAGYEEGLAQELSEVFDLIGSEGRLALRKGSSQPFDRVMEEGTLWDGELASRMMSNAGVGVRAYLDEPAIILSDLVLYNSEQLVHVVELAEANGIQHLLLVCRDLSVQSRSVLIMPAFQKRLWVAAVKLPVQQADAGEILDDLALLTGGRVLRHTEVRDLTQLQVEDLGRARRAWADLEGFGIIGGQGDTRAVRERTAELRQAIAACGDLEERRKLSVRLSRLMNGAVILKVGAVDPAEIEPYLEQAARAAELARAALKGGCVPGGGAALLDCRVVLASDSSDDRQANGILQAALEAPFRALAESAGQDADALIQKVEGCGAGFGFDVRTRQVCAMRPAGIVDSVLVLRSAVSSAVQGVAEILESMPVRDHE